MAELWRVSSAESPRAPPALPPLHLHLLPPLPVYRVEESPWRQRGEGSTARFKSGLKMSNGLEGCVLATTTGRVAGSSVDGYSSLGGSLPITMYLVVGRVAASARATSLASISESSSPYTRS